MSTNYDRFLSKNFTLSLGKSQKPKDIPVPEDKEEYNFEIFVPLLQIYCINYALFPSLRKVLSLVQLIISGRFYF
jgi:hypothetical protein